MTDREQIYYETMIEHLQEHRNKLLKENEELREKVTSLEKQIDELEWHEECETMAREEYE